jgi:hypothetical protein
MGRAIAEAVSLWLPTAAAQVWQMGFVVDKVASVQVFSEYFGFPFQNHFIPPTSPSSQSPGVGSSDTPFSLDSSIFSPKFCSPFIIYLE